jgi:ATP-dependent Clp protease ATP-binding subunit ClpC
VFERFTSRARQVIVYAQDEAHTHERIGTEHILLGLLREQDGAGAKILTGHGVDREKARDQIVVMTSARGGRVESPGESAGEA